MPSEREEIRSLHAVHEAVPMHRRASPRAIGACLGALVVALAACESAPDNGSEEARSQASAYTWRQQIDGNVASFKFVQGINAIYVLGQDGNLWREVGDSTNRTWVDANLMSNADSYQPIDGTFVYVLGSDGKLWRENWDANNETLVDSGVRNFHAIDDATVYVQHAYDSKLWREVGDSGHATQVDDHVLDFQPMGASNVYVLSQDLSLWNENGDYTRRTLVDQNVGNFRAIDTTTVYVMGLDQNLWKETGTMANRSQIDSNVLAFRPVDPTDVYVLGRDGKLWREFGSYQNRDYVDSNLYVGDWHISPFQALYTSSEPYGHGMVFVLGSDGKLWREFMDPHAAPCTTSGNYVGAGGCCDGLEPNQIQRCVPKDQPGCGVTTLGGAPPCCVNKAPCDPNGVCVTDPQNGYHYCTPRKPPSGNGSACPGGAAPQVYGCKVTDCPYTDGNLASAYFCSKDQAEAIEQQDNAQCSDVSCQAQ